MIAASVVTVDAIRLQLVRRGTRLGVLTVGYNCLEALIAIAAGVSAGSVALVGFGADSMIEVTAASPGPASRRHQGQGRGGLIGCMVAHPLYWSQTGSPSTVGDKLCALVTGSLGRFLGSPT